ncbi:hypothetical protein [Gardnerella vaginalis]|uniref:hypothetical protein n=1 Tax=Gardnerella vaginalis TaxID=2702 RepID=UPI0039705110
MSEAKDLATELHDAAVERAEARCLVMQAHHTLSAAKKRYAKALRAIAVQVCADKYEKDVNNSQAEEEQ